VYRATDTKLGRDVAIKVIPGAFAQDANRMARFAREAQVLASLNHPNIAAIYGVEESALVMELVEGPTLAERIEQGAMPVEEALRPSRSAIQAPETGRPEEPGVRTIPSCFRRQPARSSRSLPAEELHAA